MILDRFRPRFFGGLRLPSEAQRWILRTEFVPATYGGLSFSLSYRAPLQISDADILAPFPSSFGTQSCPVLRRWTDRCDSLLISPLPLLFRYTSSTRLFPRGGFLLYTKFVRKQFVQTYLLPPGCEAFDGFDVFFFKYLYPFGLVLSPDSGSFFWSWSLASPLAPCPLPIVFYRSFLSLAHSGLYGSVFFPLCFHLTYPHLLSGPRIPLLSIYF